MSQLTLALISFHVVMTVAFVCAFSFPLAIAGAEERASRSRDFRSKGGVFEILGPLLDIWLLLEDALPVFWLVRLALNAPGDVRAAKTKWREEPSVRLCFWIALAGLLTLPIYTMFT